MREEVIRTTMLKFCLHSSSANHTTDDTYYKKV